MYLKVRSATLIDTISANEIISNLILVNWVKITCATSGLGVLFEQSKRQYEFQFYCIPKCSEIAWNLFEKRGWVKNLPY
jgi:hypothetical protein